MLHVRAHHFPTRSSSYCDSGTTRRAVKAAVSEAWPGELSGGNAKKWVIAKWLAPTTRVLLLDEPTAVIDIGARTDILRLVRSLADDGLPVILVSSEFEELLAICDRLLVQIGRASFRERVCQYV